MITYEYKTRLSCRVCGSKDLELLVDFGLMPLAGGFMKPEEVSSRDLAFPLRLARCPVCTLMQLLDTVAPEIIFSQYSFASNTTRTLAEHFIEMGSEIVEAFLANGKMVVEFGCNDGVLIKSLLRAGAFALGVDPSDVAKKASDQDGWKLVNDYFTEDVARQIHREHGRARIVVGSNVFAHVEDPHTILEAVVELLEDDGVCILEVHYQGDLIDKTQFDMIYHEHICYFSLTSLTQLFRQYDLKIIDVKQIPTHSGSIRVVAARCGSSYMPSPRVGDMLEMEKGFDIEFFIRRVLGYRGEFHEYIKSLKMEGKNIGSYGAAGRMTVLMNYCGLGADLIDYIVDKSPLRYGRIVPGVLLPIVPPATFHKHPLDYMIMTAWSYETEILERERDYLNNGGYFIIPLPQVRVVGMNSDKRIVMNVFENSNDFRNH